MTVREVIRQLTDDGWIEVAQRGSHRQFKHPTKVGKVTVYIGGVVSADGELQVVAAVEFKRDVGARLVMVNVTGRDHNFTHGDEAQQQEVAEHLTAFLLAQGEDMTGRVETPARRILPGPSAEPDRVVSKELWPGIAFDATGWGAGCGNVHFAPNSRAQYDYYSRAPASSSCESYGLGDGPDGTDSVSSYTNAKADGYDAEHPDWRPTFVLRGLNRLPASW